ncbi:MAG: hypothetical protein C4520_06720 [Candidatus Abyssobacteria bacterium SURF_5]|uniref:Glycosyltransferase RgtA/B/C/D-like domain-containing protein n=1 Tax=Abyssobacteria bacterium (strain SURF_5) TaxID=2093360 RepID=A0A3A4P5U6_ABYX5|nr:MAG: hypothetical protein C4520_06720 [Candidatus Abyssubacteria bacterium SURF_5]
MQNALQKPETTNTILTRVFSDIVIALVLSLINLGVLLVCWKTQGVQADESIYIYGALQMMKGKVIYRDFWVFYPPGIFLLVISSFVLLGKSLFSLRLVLIAGASVTTLMIYLLGRTFMSKFYSAVACLLFIAVGVNLWPVFGHHWTSTFSVVAGALFMAYFLKERKYIFLGLSGFFAGTTLLLQLHKGLPLLVGGLLVLGLAVISAPPDGRSRKREFVSQASIYSLCPILFVGATFACLAAMGLLKDAWDAIIVFPSEELAGIANPNYSAPYGAYSLGLLARTTDIFGTPIINAISTQVVYAFMAFAAPVSAVLLPLGLIIRKTSPAKPEFQIPFFASVAALSCFAASLGRPDFHHLLTALPPALLTFSYCISSFGSGRLSRYSGRLLSAVVLVPALWIGIASIASASLVRVVELGSPLGLLAARSGEVERSMALAPMEKLLLFLKTSTDESEKIFVMPSSPFLYYLSERENATKFPMLMSSLNDEDQMAEVIEELRRENPRIIILDPLADWQQYQAALPYARLQDFERNPLLNYISENYKAKGSYGGFEVLERDDEVNRR